MKKRIVLILITTSILSSNLLMVHADTKPDSANIEMSLKGEQSDYIKIEKALKIDCLKGDVEQLTQYLSENIKGFSQDNIFLEFINQDDSVEKKFWICYGIKYKGAITPFKLWVYVDGNEIKYESKWNSEIIEKLISMSPVPIDRLEIERIKENYTTWVDEETVDINQQLSVSLNENFIIEVSLSTAYKKNGWIAGGSMHYYSNSDIIDLNHIDMKPLERQNQPLLTGKTFNATINESFDIDFELNNADALTKILSEKIPNFKDSEFEIELMSPFDTSHFYMNYEKRHGFYRLNQNKYVVYSLKYNGFITPYKIVVIISEDKVQYETNINEDTLSSLKAEYVFNNISIINDTLAEAIKNSDVVFVDVTHENLDTSSFPPEEIERIKQENKITLTEQYCILGIDTEHRPFIDVKSIYKRGRFEADFTTMYRYYIKY